MICGISVLDFAFEFYSTIDPEEFGFNDALFENSETATWAPISMWAYCFLIVGVLQLLKALSADD